MRSRGPVIYGTQTRKVTNLLLLISKLSRQYCIAAKTIATREGYSIQFKLSADYTQDNLCTQDVSQSLHFRFDKNMLKIGTLCVDTACAPKLEN